GLHRPHAGDISFDGGLITRLASHARVRQGLVLVPEGRRLFPSLSVEENLRIGNTSGRPGSWDLRRVFHLFPWMEVFFFKQKTAYEMRFDGAVRTRTIPFVTSRSSTGTLNRSAAIFNRVWRAAAAAIR